MSWCSSNTAPAGCILAASPRTPPASGPCSRPGNLALSLDERFEDIKFLIRDRGSNFTSSFDAVFQAAGTRILRTAVQAPRMNATCERLVGTLRRELLDRMLILGERHLRSVLAEYHAHYSTARPHQGIAQRVPDSEHDGGHPTVADLDRERIHRKPVLSGLINEYTRAALHPKDSQVTRQILFSSGTGSAGSPRTISR